MLSNDGSKKYLLYKPSKLLRVIDDKQSHDFVDTSGLTLREKLKKIYKIMKEKKQVIFYEKTDTFRHLSMITKKPYVAPQGISIDISTACNTNCIYCWEHSYLNNKNVPIKMTDEKLIKKVIEELTLHGLEWIEFSGEGEPFTHPKIMEFIEYVSKSRLKLYIYTNGLLLDKKIIDKLVEWGVSLRVNFSAADYDRYKKIHPKVTEEDYRMWLGNLKYYGKKIKNKHIKFTTENVLCDFNKGQILNILKKSEDLGATDVGFVMYSSNDEKNKLWVKEFDIKTLDECDEYLKDKKIISNIYEIRRIFKENKKMNKFSQKIKNCCYQWFYGRFMIDGSFSPCTELIGKHNVGNEPKSMIALEKVKGLKIYDNPFEKIFTSKYMLYLNRIASRWPICNKCCHLHENEILWNMNNL